MHVYIYVRKTVFASKHGMYAFKYACIHWWMCSVRTNARMCVAHSCTYLSLCIYIHNCFIYRDMFYAHMATFNYICMYVLLVSIYVFMYRYVWNACMCVYIAQVMHECTIAHGYYYCSFKELLFICLYVCVCVCIYIFCVLFHLYACLFGHMRVRAGVSLWVTICQQDENEMGFMAYAASCFFR